MTNPTFKLFHRLFLLCLPLLGFFFTACGNGVAGNDVPSAVSIPVNRGISASLSVLPSISTASPLLGNTDGNWTLTVSGSDFTNDMSVLIGSAPCTSVTVISSELLTCTAPANTAGAASVTVSNEVGHAARMDSATTYVDTVNVSQFTATATGFEVTFNRAIDIGTMASPNIHLYDVQAATLGEADVTLEGETTGEVTGTLVVDQAYKRFTFIATAGVLTPDTYTARLRSTATGFKDASGAQLDGDDDGTTGDEYTTTFTVSAISQGLTVMIPDFVRGPEQKVNVPNTSTDIPLQLVDNDLGNPLATSIQFTVVYNPASLTVTGISNGPDKDGDTSVSISQPVAGRAIITIERPSGLVGAAATMDFVRLTAHVPTGAVYGTTHLLRIEDATVGGVSEPVTVSPGLHVVGYFGDHTRNGTYSGSDGSITSRLVAAIDNGIRNWCWVDPMILADLDLNLVLNATDSSKQMQLAVGIAVTTVPALPFPYPTITFSTEP